ncbi:(2Fe-2S) ferredoxin domain-containing protein [Flavobacterium sp. NG2]|uniref:(2Fe-2S) ferredoxin domain-containing protein n=1 Tax=Flavobacterium sp. NG2 TaxID=3097547 RepID=UPI002A808747|nr:(2Fe-2S) ferredoxin domain-containing protein [Flavobacterium sp. NG2]WPR72285.1 (2Fe-2S) ferredoxin domain-containing protein [Flavobacterium sp. NG2]
MSAKEFPKKAIFICNGSKCGKHKEIKKYFKHTIKEQGLKHEIEVFNIECSDRCKCAPIVYNQSENQWHEKVTLSQAEKIMEKLKA